MKSINWVKAIVEEDGEWRIKWSIQNNGSIIDCNVSAACVGISKIDFEGCGTGEDVIYRLIDIANKKRKLDEK